MLLVLPGQTSAPSHCFRKDEAPIDMELHVEYQSSLNRLCLHIPQGFTQNDQDGPWLGKWSGAKLLIHFRELQDLVTVLREVLILPSCVGEIVEGYVKVFPTHEELDEILWRIPLTAQTG
jgi:hypothetical protein